MPPGWWRSIGPGIVAGASENDPTTVVSLAVVGSLTAYSLGWLVLLVAPMLAVVQSMAAHVGAVRKHGLETIVKRTFGMWPALVLLAPLVVVNLFTLCADLEGGSEAVSLLTGADRRWFALPIAVSSAFLLIRGNYTSVRKVLSFVPLVFLTYAAAAFLAHPNWRAVAVGSLLPNPHFGREQTTGAIALLGTTITAYAYVWGSIEASKERGSPARLRVLELDSVLGTAIAVLSFWFVLVATAATLGVRHQPVETARDAAMALAPAAGRYATVLFAAGLLGSALLAVPVIAATTAYAVSAVRSWKRELDASFAQAPQFYAIVAGVLLVAGIAASLNLDAVTMLYWSSIAGGLATPVSLAMLVLAAGSRKAMHGRTAHPALLVCGWAVTAIVAAAAVAFIVQSV